MPAATPNNAVTISERSRLTLGMAIVLVTLFLAATTGWFTVATQAGASLTREDALKTYVTAAQYGKDQAALETRLTRMEGKLDRLLERGG